MPPQLYDLDIGMHIAQVNITDERGIIKTTLSSKETSKYWAKHLIKR